MVLEQAARAITLAHTGKAEAEQMRARAEAYKAYGDAAVTSMVLEGLPKIAAEVSAPLAKTKEIVVVGGDNKAASEVAKLAGTLPPAVQALTGVDITQVHTVHPKTCLSCNDCR